MSRALHDPKSWRELRNQLHCLGAKFDRQRGSHQVWRFDDGEVFVVVGNHLRDAVDQNIVVKFRRLRARRRESGEPPSPLGRTGSQWSRPDPRAREEGHEQRK